MNKLLKKFLNLFIFGVGLGILTGSLFKIIIPIYEQDKFNISLSNLKFPKGKDKSKRLNLNRYKLITSIKSGKEGTEILELSKQWEQLSNKYKDLKVSGYLYLIEEGKHSKLNPNAPYSAASSIKIPILLATLEMVDTGNLLWNERVTLNKSDIAMGAGWMAYQPIGTRFPIYELATEMIRVSDNTATNLLIKRLGGINYLNDRFEKYGLESTELKRLLPDLQGYNKTSAKDLALTIAIADSNYLLSKKTRDLFREVMSTSRTNRLLPGGFLKGLNKFNISLENIDYKLLINGYRIYNKTGDIGIAYADAGLIEIPNNNRAVAGFIVEGPFNDPRSTNLIREMAAAMVDFLQPEEPASKSNKI